jgi:hypothetical protein
MLTMIDAHEYDQLYAHDQLKLEMREGRVFPGKHMCILGIFFTS